MQKNQGIDFPCPVRRIGKGGNHHFFGYYNKSIWDAGGRYMLALEVDRVFDEDEIIVRGLGAQLKRVRMIAGAAVSGSGKVIPVLSVADIFSVKKMEENAVNFERERKREEYEDVSKGLAKSVLVVEDSVTARSLLKSVLESSGFTVKTAVDGSEAYVLLRSEKFDIVISDIDMPRMSGIELTEKIRKDSMLQNLPVVLVSALESREDIERGIEAGANAYIVKSRFDDANLIETIKKIV